jgi:hypothetical protein
VLAASPSVAAAALPPQGLYEECAPSNQQQCAGELAQMGTAGFRLALNYSAWDGSAADIQTYASEAQTDGVKLIWPLNDSAWRDGSSLAATYPTLAGNCGCASNDGFLQYAIGLVRSLPATWGYYIGDEVDPSHASQVAALATKLRALDPTHPLLYIGQSYPDTATNLGPFLLSADVVGADIYPIGAGGSPSLVSDVANTVQQLDAKAHRQSAIALQAFDWTQYPGQLQLVNPRWPTEIEMRNMRDRAAITNPSMILWYSIYDILRSDNPAKHWHDLRTAAFGRGGARPPSNQQRRRNARRPGPRHLRHAPHRRHAGAA